MSGILSRRGRKALEKPETALDAEWIRAENCRALTKNRARVNALKMLVWARSSVLPPLISHESHPFHWGQMEPQLPSLSWWGLECQTGGGPWTARRPFCSSWRDKIGGKRLRLHFSPESRDFFSLLFFSKGAYKLTCAESCDAPCSDGTLTSSEISGDVLCVQPEIPGTCQDLCSPLLPGRHSSQLIVDVF